MAEEKLVHPIVTARTLSRGDGRGNKRAHTHAEEEEEEGGGKQIQIRLLILSSLHSLYLNADVFTSV